MTDVDGKSGGRNFKKRAHRPWKTSLLETTIQESKLENNPDGLEFSFDSQPDSTASPFYADFNFTNLTDKFSQLETIAIHSEPAVTSIDEVKHDLISAIKQTQQQRDLLEQKISDKSTKPILLGGFFEPQQLGTQAETPNGRKMNFLLSDLKNKEHELNSLTNNLKLSEAMIRSEQSELNRRAEEHGRLAAEERVRKAVEQAQIVSEQFRAAMEQANQAALAHREEERLRKIAEAQIKKYELRANSAELELQSESAARIIAEQKAQQAELTSQELQQVTEQLHKTEFARKNEESRRLETEKQYENLSNAFIKIEAEHKESFSKVYNLETDLKNLHTKLLTAEQKLAEITAQRDKLKTIIETEQDLRKNADKRAFDALQKLEQTEKALQAEEQQRKITDERAKQAVEYANRTVMHLLSAPSNLEPTSKDKPKIRVQEYKAQEIVETSDDDYSF